jgi:PIN domain nuclease of toxin-antitoxin system
MRLLLDTHVLLWWLDRSDRLNARHQALIEAGETEPWVSAASIWELSIKMSKGRLSIDGDLLGSIKASNLSLLDVNENHAWAAGGLPPHHADPFDRMLVAQGQIESMTIATVDPVFSLYDVPTI